MNRTLLRGAALLALAFAVAGGQAADVDLADKPMGNSIDPDVKPNIMLVLDRSGSMSWSHMPDQPVVNLRTKYGYKSSQCNGVYYNPNVTYTPPVKADGTPYPDSSFTGAWNDGFNTGSGVVNLNTSFRAYSDGSSGTFNTLSGSGASGADTAQPAYYYQYNGAGGTSGVKQKAMSYVINSDGSVNTSNPPTAGATWFYSECNQSTGAGAAASSTWTKVIINTASPASVQTNFANWYSYYRIRMNMMKTATGLALSRLNDPAKIRLGIVYHDSSSVLPIADYSDPVGVTHITSSCSSGTTQRARLYCFLYTAAASGSTPSRTALSRCGQMYSGTGSYVSATRPDPVQYSCQRNTVILATDGFWNTDSCPGSFPCVGNADSDVISPHDPPTFDTVATSSNSMADIARYYWKTDLRTSGAVSKNNVPTSTKDPANWQHMVTFTLGLGANGVLKYVDGYEVPGTSVDYDDLVAGTKSWPNPIPTENATRMDDLWHAAVNGRGTYFAANTVEALANGLKKAFAEAATTGAGTSAAVGSLVLLAGDSAYLASYQTVDWYGDLTKNSIDASTAVVSGTASWSAKTQLNLMVTPTTDSRTIYMAKSGVLADFNETNLTAAIASKWFDVGPTNPNGQLEQYTFFTAAQIANATPENLIKYLRGQRAYEDSGNDVLSTASTEVFRGRPYILGDIANSSPAYVKQAVFDYTDGGYSTFKSATASRAGVVYVGANDGMLHAFNAETGNELWAFVPTAVMPYLYKLADKNYYSKHRYYVDGALTVGDVKIGGSWRTILAGGLGRGGRAYFAFDVTEPTNPILLWEFGATATDTSSPSTFDNDLGYGYGAVELTKLNGGAWVALFGSGYNNTSPGTGAGRLYMVDVASGAKLAEIPTTGGTDPSLSGIGWVNGWTDDGMRNNSVKHVYAGDLGGRVWRFDIVAETATLLTTLGQVNGVSVVQPVTTRVVLGDWANDVNERVIYVGTGRYLGFDDVANTDRMSFYAIRDSSTALKSNIGAPFFRNSGAVKLVTGNRNSSFTYNNVSANSYGWYMDFDAEDGERVNVHPRLFGDQNNLVVVTNLPSSDKCDIGGTGYVYFLNAQASKSYTVTASDMVTTISGAMAVGATAVTDASGKTSFIVGKSSGQWETISGKPQSYGNAVRRVSWRELRN